MDRLDPLRRHTPTGDLVLEWARLGTYRIVKLDVPKERHAAGPWYIVRAGWFGSIYGVPGSDRGAPGEYNHQLEEAGNHIALVENLAEIAQQKLTPRVVTYRGADALPTKRIVAEIDIASTIRAMVRSGSQDIHHLCDHCIVFKTV